MCKAGQSFSRRMVGLLLILSLTLCSGCREKEPAFEVLALEGKVQRIESRPDGTGSITVVYYSDKQGKEVVGKGVVTRETEIMINGAIASLSDIREGERIRGQVRVEPGNQNAGQIALKIYVDRATPVDGEG